MATADTRHRVKVYSFNESGQWEDMGTGHVSITFMERLQSLSVLVRSEENGSVLLESKVVPDRPYQKQEETLIVWTEDESCDLALSFQEKLGCDEVWEKICEVQGRSPSILITQDISEDGDMSERFDDSSFSIELPPCELSKLDEVLGIVTNAIPSVMKRENLALAMERENYISKLLELFHMCEDLENLDGLHHLYRIFRTLFLLNNISLLQVLFQDGVVDDVIGCLEYDPNKPRPVKHREYIAKISKHREVIPFNNPELLAKIHQTYKVQYIQEVILPMPSLFEENMMSALNSFIMYNKVEIINAIQEDQQFLRELFSQLRDESTSERRYRELAHLLREILMFSLALELGDRTKFFQQLATFGFMAAIEGMLTCEAGDVVASAVDILTSIAEFSCSVLRDYILSETQDEDTQFLNIIIGLLVDGQYPEIDVQLVGLTKTLADSENIMTETGVQTVEKSLFLNHFYKHSMHRLMAPLMAQTSGETISHDTSYNAVLLSHILDILSLCVERHTYHIRNYVIDKNVLARVLVLLTSSHSHLALAAVRFCRKIVGLKDEFYNRYIVRNNLLAPIVSAFMANGQRYNLLNSAIIELFEYLRAENVKTLISYIIENFMTTLETVEYVDTFRNLRLCHEQEMDRVNNMPAEPSTTGGIIHVEVSRYRRDPRQLDEDEEAWFDDEEENMAPADTLPETATLEKLNSTPMMFTSSSYSPRPAAALSRMAAISSDSKLPTISAALQSLVDYDEDSDEETNLEENSSPAKRQKLNTT